MFDEDTGEAIACPFCKSTSDCEHLLAEIDRTFLECPAGYASNEYNKFGEVVRTAFKPLLASGAKPAWNDDALEELWDYAVEFYSPDDDEASLDGDVLNRLIIDLLVGAGDASFTGTSGDDMGPRFSSALTAIYAENPQAACERALQRLRELLAPRASRRRKYK